MAASISTGLVQLHRQYYGKGPTKAKTHFVNDMPHEHQAAFLE